MLSKKRFFLQNRRFCVHFDKNIEKFAGKQKIL